MGMSETGLAWKNLYFQIINKHGREVKLLHDVSGSIDHGLLTVMGPSGCGKTTFMKLLAGRVKSDTQTSGEITYQGKKRNPRKWIQSGFVDQDDIIFNELTAYECFKYAMMFKHNGNETPEMEREIQFIVDKLSLKDIEAKKMKTLSGGERKRVLSGVEIIKDPEILFLDDPTSGLDNFNALKLVKYLKMISKKKIVVFSIHQPDDCTADEFEQILLL